MYETCQELYAKRVDGKYTESFEPVTLKYTRIRTIASFFFITPNAFGMDCIQIENNTVKCMFRMYPIVKDFHLNLSVEETLFTLTMIVYMVNILTVDSNIKLITQTPLYGMFIKFIIKL